MANSPVGQIASRDAELESPLADPKRMTLVEFTGSEHVNELGEFRLRVICPGGRLNDGEVKKLIGGQITVTMTTEGKVDRVFAQTCFGLRSLGVNGNGAVYELELRPWIWIMSQRRNSRIFYRMTVTEIVKTLVSEYGGAPLDDKAGSTYPQLEYTVQYQESDLDFVRRLLEQFGINFHIDMRSGAQVLVLSNSADDFAEPFSRSRSFQPGNEASNAEEIFDHWINRRHFTPNAVRMIDYNYEKPVPDMKAETTQTAQFSAPVVESYEHPGRYKEQKEGNSFAKRRLDALRSADDRTQARGNALTLGAGMRFKLNDDGGAGLKDEYAVLSATHFYTNSNFGSGGSGDSGYSGEYTFFPAASPIAPDQVTPRPYLRGPQSAEVVTGAETGGQVDEHGRIKVKFPWGGKDQSIFCRVSQLWAGSNWGGHFIPQVGMEVLVDFMEGDPDRPVIVGCLYNGVNKHPFPSGDMTFKSGIMTRSQNRLEFNDKPDSAEIVVNASKDLTFKVADKESITVEGDSETTVKGEKKVEVDGAVLIKSEKIIELKVGSSSIKIEPTQITISSPNVTVSAQGNLEAKGTIAKIEASGPMTIKAAIVTIN